MSKVGVASNDKNEFVEAISYGLAKELKTDDFYVQNSKDFKNVEYVEKLPPRKPIAEGVVETVEEVIKGYIFATYYFFSHKPILFLFVLKSLNFLMTNKNLIFVYKYFIFEESERIKYN